MTIELAAALERHPDSQWSWLGDELVVLDPAGIKLRALNSTGACAWERFDGTRSLQAIAEQLAGEFGAPVTQVAVDLLAFARGLLDRALVRAHSAEVARPSPAADAATRGAGVDAVPGVRQDRVAREHAEAPGAPGQGRAACGPVPAARYVPPAAAWEEDFVALAFVSWVPPGLGGCNPGLDPNCPTPGHE